MAARKWSLWLTVLALTASLSTSALADSHEFEATTERMTTTQIEEALTRAGIIDVSPDHWAAGSIVVLVDVGLLHPSETGEFRPDEAPLADAGIALFAKVVGIASKTDDDATAVLKAQQAGIVGDVVLNRPLTRLEVARLLATILGLSPATGAPVPFTDLEGVHPEDVAMLAALKALGIFKGFPDGTFGVDHPMTNAQLAVLIDQILAAQ